MLVFQCKYWDTYVQEKCLVVNDVTSIYIGINWNLGNQY